MKLLLAGLAALTLGSTLLHANPAQCNVCVRVFCSGVCAPGCACVAAGDGSGWWCQATFR